MSFPTYTHYTCAVDEVGRGCLAGPVTACAVIITEPQKISVSRFLGPPGGPRYGTAALLGDSKKLTPKQREQIYDVITRLPYIQWAVASVSPKVIDRVNIHRATCRAASRAVRKLSLRPDLVIVDGNMRLPIRIAQQAIVKADEKILACSLASIIAKVTRDRMMVRLHKKYPQYHFDIHKGYGTKLHYEMLRKHGKSPIHRVSFRLQ
jgi:ribonuclease HII